MKNVLNRSFMCLSLISLTSVMYGCEQDYGIRVTGGNVPQPSSAPQRQQEAPQPPISVTPEPNLLPPTITVPTATPPSPPSLNSGIDLDIPSPSPSPIQVTPLPNMAPPIITINPPSPVTPPNLNSGISLNIPSPSPSPIQVTPLPNMAPPLITVNPPSPVTPPNLNSGISLNIPSPSPSPIEVTPLPNMAPPFITVNPPSPVTPPNLNSGINLDIPSPSPSPIDVTPLPNVMPSLITVASPDPVTPPSLNTGVDLTIPSPSPTACVGQGQPTSDPNVCSILAAKIYQSQGQQPPISEMGTVQQDGTCDVEIGANKTSFPLGTTLLETTVENGTKYTVIDSECKVSQSIYIIEGRSVVVNVPSPVPSATARPERIVFPEQFHFEIARWAIEKVDRPLVQALAHAIYDLATEQGSALERIEIQGNTDDMPPKPGVISNQLLSERRAASVRSAILTALADLETAHPHTTTPDYPSMLVSEGFGSSRPIAGPHGRDRAGKQYFTKADRDLNRRVEFVVRYSN